MKILGKHGVPDLSELDDFITQFTAHRKTAADSQIAEFEKHEKLFAKRDKKMSPDDTKIWEGF